MNKIIATIKSIDSVDNLNIVKFDCLENILTMMSLDLNSDIRIGAKVYISIKPTHIAIAKNFNGIISDENQLKANIVEINNGRLLSSIRLNIKDKVLESIITKESACKMDLKTKEEVMIFIKASELSIQEVLND